MGRTLGQDDKGARATRSAILATAMATVIVGLLPANAVSAPPATAVAAVSSGSLVVPAGLSAGEAIPGELVVRMRGQQNERVLALPAGIDESDALAALHRNPAVVTATRDYVVRAAGSDDPGRIGVPGGWREDQWHLLDTAGGVNAPPAWEKLVATEQRFGRYSRRKRGPIVAVVDTGVAYRYAKGGRFRRSPDLARGLFVAGKDFIDGDRRPLDGFGHGTHMASTIAEGVRNGRAVRGLAPGVRLMPVRVLDDFGFGRTSTVARGVRWASRHGARIINTSIEYGGGVPDCKAIPALCRSFRAAMRGGALMVAAAGNSGRAPIPVPARTLVVGSATLRGCLAAYSNRGDDIDLLAPGGGRDADGSGAGCDPDSNDNPGIVQLTMTPRGRSFNRFAFPRIVGTSSAAAHASGVTALVLASGVIGPAPKPLAIAAHLRSTGRPAVGLPPNTGAPPLLDAAGALGATVAPG